MILMREAVVNGTSGARLGRAVLAGLVGTVVFDLLGFLMTGQWWDIPALLGGKLGWGSAVVSSPTTPMA